MFFRRNAPGRVLVLLLPVALFVAAVIYYLNLREREGAEDALAKMAATTAAALDRQISTEIAVLSALATDPDLDRGDIPAFIDHARRVALVNPRWFSIAVTDQEKGLGSTRTGMADPPRPLADPKGTGEVFRTGRPYVSGVLPVHQRIPEPYYLVRVPVTRGGVVRYTLSAAVRAWSLHELLRQLPVVDGGRIGFLDQSGKVIARSNSVDPSDGLIGDLPSRSVLDGVTQGTEAVYRATPIGDDPAYIVARRHDASGWTTLIAAPAAALDAPRIRMLMLAGGGAGAALLLTVWAAIVMARATTRWMEAERRVAALEADAAKRQAESVLAKVMDTLPVGVFILDDRGVIVGTNPEARRIWGGALNVPVDEYSEYKGWHRDSGRRIESREWAAARALLKGEVTRGEVVNIESFDGVRKTISNTSIPLTNDEGCRTGALTVVEDITDRHRIQEELRLSNERMRLVVNANVIGIVTASVDGRVLEANDYFLNLLGYSREEFEAGHLEWDSLTPPAYRHLDERAMAEVSAKGLSTPYEKENILRDGSRIWIYLVLAKLTGTETIVAFVQNFTRRRRAEDQRAAAMAQAEAARVDAERANLSKSKFLAAASHDLRQPVQSLYFLLSALENQVRPGAEKTLSHASEALAALKSLLDGLLDISRLDAGAVEPDVREFPVAALLEQIDAEYRPMAEAKGLHWHVGGSGGSVRSDPDLLGRMLRNLAQNAIRYTETGSVLLTCRISGDRARIQIQDTGIGIPADKVNDIFEEFHQVGNAHRDRAQGLGLGLAIVKRLSKLLGHPVDVRSIPGEGSTFSVTVPTTAAPAAEPPVAELIPIAQGDGQLVVVIDDEDLVRFGVKALVKSWGYDVLDAASGPQALAALQGSRRTPSLIVSDYRLPEGRSGVDVICGIRSLFGEKIPAILLTGETTQQCTMEAAAEEITVVHKPISPAQLHEVLSLMAERSGDGLSSMPAARR